MAKLKYRSISKRTVDALKVEDRDAVFWDDRLPGFGDCESMEPSQSPDRGSLTLAAGWPMASWLPSTRGVTTPQNRARSASGAGQLGVVVKSSRNRRHIRRNLDFQRDFTRQSPPTVAFADSTP